MEEHKAPHKDRFLKGRQIAYMIYENFWTSGTGEALLDFNYLMRVTLKNDNIQGLGTK